jgi:hypothetical protein
MGEYGMAETLRQFFIQDKTLTESEAEFIFVNSDANYWHEIIVENQKLINVAQRKIDYAKNKFEDINKINL